MGRRNEPSSTAQHVAALLKCRLCASTTFQYAHKLRRSPHPGAGAPQPSPRQPCSAAPTTRRTGRAPLGCCGLPAASALLPSALALRFPAYKRRPANPDEKYLGRLLFPGGGGVTARTRLGGSHHSFHQHITSYCRCVSRHFSALPCTVSRLGPGVILT